MIFVALIALYLIVGYYYSKGFPCRTWINGIYCTGKSVDAVNYELCKKYKYDGINIKDLNGSDLFISADDMGFKVDYTDALNEFISDQDSLLWGMYFFKGLKGEIEPAISSDKDKIGKIISVWDIFIPDESLDVSIIKTDNGYKLDNSLLPAPNKEKIINAVSDATLKAESKIDLSTDKYSDCYEPVKLTAEQQEVVDLYSKLDPIINCDITYEFGSKRYVLKDGIACDFILTSDQLKASYEEEYDYENPGKDKYIAGGSEINIYNCAARNFEGFVVTQNGDPLISEARMYDFFYKLSQQSYTATALDRYKNGEDVEIFVSKSRSGNPVIFDHNDEFNSLKRVFELGENVKEVRQLSNPDKVNWFNAKEDLGGTYIEVDVSAQHLYYYVNGEVSIETDIVTGDMAKGHGTPSGFFHVYDKQRDKTLKGDDYETLVHYWMRLNNNGIGIHDAYWKHEFGGDIYQYNGSHGCINCPPDMAELLWNNVKNKTPVIVYYR